FYSARSMRDGFWAEKTDEHARVADAFEQVAQHARFVLAVEALAERAVRGNANRFASGSVVDEVRIFIPVGFAETEPMHLAAGGAVAVEVSERPLGIAVLPGVDAFGLGMADEFDDAFGRVPGGLV